MRKIKKPVSRLRKRVQQGFRGYPAATIALYGPTAELATKVAVAIFREEGQKADPLEHWFSENTDVRQDPAIEDQIVKLLRLHNVRSVVMADRIIGCPHEEGIDYPDGKSCPKCPYWAGRDRWTGIEFSNPRTFWRGACYPDEASGATGSSPFGARAMGHPAVYGYEKYLDLSLCSGRLPLIYIKTPLPPLPLRSAKPFILTATLARMIISGLNRFATFRHRRAKPPSLRKL
jgi:hypothetical protein